jgi:class 3 adenylate cyclase
VSETRKLAAILVSDVVGYSRLTGADEDRILARLRALRSDLIDPTIAVHKGRVVKRTGDGAIVEFRSVVDAVNCAIEIQRAMVERNAEVAPDKRIEFRLGIHLGDVVEESDGDLMGDGVNIAARLQGVATPGGICISDDAYRQVKGRLDLKVSDLGPVPLKNIAEPMRAYSLEVGAPSAAKAAAPADQRKSLTGKTRLAFAPLAVGERANDLDWLLAGAEDRPRREAHGRVLGVVAGLREEPSPPRNHRPSGRYSPDRAHRCTWHRARRSRAACRSTGNLPDRPPHGVNVALAHQDAVVGADQQAAERMMAMPRGLARDFIGGAKVGEHLIAGHGRSRS